MFREGYNMGVQVNRVGHRMLEIYIPLTGHEFTLDLRGWDLDASIGSHNIRSARDHDIHQAINRIVYDCSDEFNGEKDDDTIDDIIRTIRRRLNNAVEEISCNQYSEEDDEEYE